MNKMTRLCGLNQSVRADDMFFLFSFSVDRDDCGGKKGRGG